MSVISTKGKQSVNCEYFGEVRDLVELQFSSFERKLKEKRDEIVKYKRQLKLKDEEIVRLREALSINKDESRKDAERRETEISRREQALKENTLRADRELHTKWEMLFLAQQRLGEQENEFNAQKKEFNLQMKRLNIDHTSVTPAGTPSKGRRTVSSPLSKTDSPKRV